MIGHDYQSVQMDCYGVIVQATFQNYRPCLGSQGETLSSAKRHEEWAIVLLVMG